MDAAGRSNDHVESSIDAVASTGRNFQFFQYNIFEALSNSFHLKT
jgi:hypothetical protein